MKEYGFADFDCLMFENYPMADFKNNTAFPTNVNELQVASLYSSFQNGVDEGFLTETNYMADTELEYLDFSRWCNNDRPAEVNEQDKVPTSEQNSTASDHDTAKSPKKLTSTSCKLLKRLEEKKTNLVLVATSLDANEVVRKLENTMDRKTCRIIPLPFKDDEKEQSDDVLLELEPNSSGSDDSENSYGESTDSHEQKSRRTSLKRKQLDGKDERYWKRRNSNNAAAKRSREAKRARFIWIEGRTKELEVENARLEEKLKTLQTKLAELEGGF